MAANHISTQTSNALPESDISRGIKIPPWFLWAQIHQRGISISYQRRQEHGKSTLQCREFKNKLASSKTRLLATT